MAVAEIATVFVAVLPCVSIRRREGEAEEARDKSRGRAKIKGTRPKMSNNIVELSKTDFEGVAILSKQNL